jgi:hypothetical protein
MGSMNARRLGSMVLGALCALTVGLALTSAPALAAAPETPEVTVESVTAFAATFHGVLNPKEALEPNNLGGTYRFLYREASAKTGCTGGKVTKPSSLYFGGVHEEVFKLVSGLTADTEYVVCMSVTNLEGETAQSAPVAFTTAIPPEKPQTSEPAADITATSAKLEGTLDPHSTMKVGGYFAWSNPGGSSCTEGPTVGLEEFEGEKEAATAVHATVGLEPARTYRVCLVATDERGEPTPGNEVVVNTLALAPEVLTGAAEYSNATPLEATLRAEVNANGQETTVYFQYSTSPALVGKSLGTPTDVPAAPGSGIGAGFGYVGVEDGTGHVLAPGTVSYYQAVAINPTGATYGTVGEFETLGVPTVQTGAAEKVTAASAELGGKLDAGGEAEYYIEYGTQPCSVSTNSCGAKSGAVLGSGKVQKCGLGGVLHECVYPIAVGGLEPNTTYHYWLVANNAAASEPVHGEAMQFTTKLGAPQSGLPEGLTPTSAQIMGELDPGGGGEVEYYVEYLSPQGTIAQSATAHASGKAGVSVGPVVLGALQPNTTYWYWLVARTSPLGEPVNSEAHAFTTPQSRAEEEAQEAAGRKPAQERAAAAAAKQKLAEEEAERAQEAAAANGAKQRQYEEIATQATLLAGQEAQTGKQSAKEEKAKSRRASCRKGFVKKKNKCVSKKRNEKGRVSR